MKITGEFADFVGLNIPKEYMPPYPCVEIGWRLNKKFWRLGYATEVSYHALNYTFNTLPFNEVVEFTTLNNKNSLAVMSRLWMIDSCENFTIQILTPLILYVNMYYIKLMRIPEKNK